MKIFFVVGEKSGDMHAASLAKELQVLDARVQMEGWGGKAMQEVGVQIRKFYHDYAQMGADFLGSLLKFWFRFKTCKKDILSFEPDVLLLLDFGGFNLRLAKWAKTKGIPVVYYVLPKTWAWNADRNYSIQKNVTVPLVILPFEEPYFRQNGIPADYVGNPSKNSVDRFLEQNPAKERCFTAILPGSRKGEVLRNEKLLKKIVEKFPKEHFVVCAVPELPIETYQGFKGYPNLRVVVDKTFSTLQESKVALVCSGTATLECALLGTPQLVLYSASRLTYFLAKRWIKVRFISLVNLLLDRELVPEIIQDAVSFPDICVLYEKLLFDNTFRENQFKGYKELDQKLGSKNASEEAAKKIYERFK